MPEIAKYVFDYYLQRVQELKQIHQVCIFYDKTNKIELNLKIYVIFMKIKKKIGKKKQNKTWSII